MRVSKNFVVQEFVYPELYSQFGERSVMFVPRTIVLGAQALRDHFGKSVTINNWHNGGQRKLSGLRPFSTKVGARFSLHKFALAIDILVESIDYREVYDQIHLNYKDKFSPFFTTVEHIDDVNGWNHLDARNVDHIPKVQLTLGGLYIVRK